MSAGCNLPFPHANTWHGLYDRRVCCIKPHFVIPGGSSRAATTSELDRARRVAIERSSFSGISNDFCPASVNLLSHLEHVSRRIAKVDG
jgi:hypothetical protein